MTEITNFIQSDELKITKKFNVIKLTFIVSFILICFTATNVIGKNVTVEWSRNDSADYYVVYWGNSSGDYSQQSVNIDSTETQYTAVGISESSTCYFAVKSFNTCGNASDFSDEIISSATTGFSCSISSPLSEQSIMAGSTINFQGSTIGGSGTLNYAWNFGGSGAGTKIVEDPGNITFSNTGTYTVTFTVTDDSSNVVSDTVKVNVASDTIPSASISSPLLEQSIMVGMTVNFQGNASGGNGSLTYMWDFDGGSTVKTVEDPGNVVFSTAGTYSVSFIVTDTDGDVASDSIKINVASDTIPAASIINPSSEQSIYAGTSVNFQGNATGGNAPLTYQWDFDGGAATSSVEDPGNVVFTTAGVYEVAFTVTDSDGDVALNTVIVNVASDTVPSASIVNPISERSIMTGGVVNFQGSGLGGNAPLTYHWDFDGAVSSSLSMNPGNVMFSDAGLYVVVFSVTDTDGDVVSDTVNVVVVDDIVPVVSIAKPASLVEIEKGEMIDFQGTVTGGNTPLSYVWNFDGGSDQSLIEDPGNVTFSNAGTYNVSFTVTDADGDVVSESVTIIVPTTTTVDTEDPVDGDTEQPDPVYPAEEIDVPLTPELQADIPDQSGHSRWQISTDLNFTSILIDILKNSDLSYLKVPRLVLTGGTKYYWRVSRNNTKSDDSTWSETMSFTTTTDVVADDDSNGVFDMQDIDDSVDVDLDGVPDIEQDDIKCVRNIIKDSNVIGVKKGVNVEEIEIVESIDHRDIEDTVGMPDEMPAGLIGFKIKVTNPGDTAEVVVCFSESAPENAGWYKYDSIHGWQNYTSWVLFSRERMSVTITLTDGGLGDADGIENGVIVDPGGLGIVSSTLPTAFSEMAAEKGCFIESSRPFNSAATVNSFRLLFVILLICFGLVALQCKLFKK